MQFKVLDQKSLVWLVTGTEHGNTLTAFYEVHESKKWFTDRVFRIRDAFNRGRPDMLDGSITDELCSALFPGVLLETLETAKDLIIVPDDILFLLPLEMLSNRGRYVLAGKQPNTFRHQPLCGWPELQ